MNFNPELREEKFAMIRRWTESGLTQKQFCEKENTTLNNFQYWLKQYRIINKAETRASFIKVPMQKQPKSCYAELELKSGTIIRFFSPLSLIELKALLS